MFEYLLHLATGSNIKFPWVRHFPVLWYSSPRLREYFLHSSLGRKNIKLPSFIFHYIFLLDFFLCFKFLKFLEFFFKQLIVFKHLNRTYQPLNSLNYKKFGLYYMWERILTDCNLEWTSKIFAENFKKIRKRKSRKKKEKASGHTEFYPSPISPPPLLNF